MSREQLAYHEAGHAVAALAIGGRVSRVWIDASGGCSEGMEGRPIYAAYELAVCLAGPASAELANGSPPSGVDLAGTDLAQAKAGLRRCPWITKDDALAGIFGWLRQPDVWPKVERVAGELVERGEIVGIGDLLRVAWGKRTGAGWARQWGEPLRRAFPPGPPGTPGMERAIRTGLVGPS